MNSLQNGILYEDLKEDDNLFLNNYPEEKNNIQKIVEPRINEQIIIKNKF